MAEWYDSGSLAVEEGSVSIVGTETLFMTRAKDGDMLVTFQGGNLRINQVVAREDDNHLTIAPPWSGDTDSGLVYYLVPTGPGWNDISSVARDLATFLATRASFFPTEGKPAADIGGNGSFAIDANASPPLLYSKTAGSWDDGKSLGGPVGAPGKGFGGTSSDSKTIANSGSMSFSTQAGLAWQQGSRMRIASTTAPTTKWMEGVVTSYSGPTLVLTVDRQGTGSGSASDWTFSAAGIPGEKGDAPKFSGTSTSSKTIATGSVTVSTQSDLAFGLGSRVMLASAANTANFMSGPVTAYASGSMSVNVDFTGGSGTFSDWVITLAGARGATGAAAKNFAATSTTSRAIGSTGTMTWTIGNDKAYQVNDLVRLCVADDPTKWMKGIVSDYSGGVLSVAINEKSGTGTYANWTINLAGETGGKGDKGDRGAPLVPRGNYADDAIYQVLDIVANAGSTWIYINETPGSGHAPPTIPTTENTYWRLLARRGEDGTDGTSFAPDYRGTFSDRSTYDTADAGKAYLSIDGDGDEITSAVLFFKKSSTSGDWSEPTQFQGPKGDGGASATVEVGDVTTLAAGEEATVENVGTESAARFNFGIPQGDKGDPGTTDYMALDNRPTLGSAAAANTEDFATAAQGSKADTAVQPEDLAAVATSGEYGDLTGRPALGEVLTADAVYYIRADGDDANTGLSNTSGGAWLTVSKALAVTKAILRNGYKITINIADGTYTYNSQITLDTPQGPDLRIIGNTTTPSNVLFQSPGSNALFYLGSGDGPFIDGIEAKQSNPTNKKFSAGFLADRGASLRLGQNVISDGFYWNYFARRDAYLEAIGTTGTNGGDANYHTLGGGTIDATNSTASGANASADFLGSGYVAEGGVITATGATASGNWLSGFRAIENGTIKADNSSANTSTTGSGFYVDTGGSIYAGGSTADGNARYGKEIADEASAITGTITNPGTANTLGLSNLYVAASSSSTGARLTAVGATNADLELSASGTGLIKTKKNVLIDASGPTITFNLGGPYIRVPATNTLAFGAGTDQYTASTTVFYPNADNARTLGDGSHRWSTVYAASGTINTSDGRQKTIRGELTPQEIAAWGDVRLLIFQWNDAICEKGEGARLHAGAIAQDVQAAFARHGLDASRYALWCSDELYEDVEISTDSIDNDAPPTIERRATGETRLGLRYDNCLIFEAAWTRHKFHSIKTALSSVELTSSVEAIARSLIDVAKNI